jgi:hypothetical protein
MRRSRDIWVLAFLFIALAVGLHYLTRPKQDEENTIASTYNADPRGTKAFYALLGDRLGYKVRRLAVPYDKMPGGARVLIVVEPDWESSGSPWPEMEDRERSALTSWVTNGGTLIFASKQPLDSAGFPLHRVRNGRFGKGWVYTFDSPRTITNRGMRDYRNAVNMTALVSQHASKRDLILFDEYHHGYAQSKPFLAMISRPVKMSLIVFAVAGLLAAYSKGRRFGAVRQAPEVETIRPGSEFVEAVGRLYRRAGATDVAAEIMRDSFLPRLYRKLGVQPDSDADLLTNRLNAVCGQDGAAAVMRLLKTLPAGHKPSEQELLHITRGIQQLEKELGLERSRN